MRGRQAPRYRAGQRFGSWTLSRIINDGGNGEVWEVENDTGEARALKVLTRFGGDGYPRFRREVEIVSELDPNAYAVLPILDASVPEQPTRDDPPWYVMPLATEMAASLKGATLIEKVGAIRQIAGTLGALAQLQTPVHHRDVKLPNLFNHQGLFVVGDFGLAKRPTDEDLTEDGSSVGPWRHLPSEVFVASVEPDPEKVDVHCLALCLWQLAANSDQPPRGSIAAGGEYDLTRFTREHHAGALSTIIAGATSENPLSRPTLAAFADQLGAWLEGSASTDALVREDDRVRRIRNEVLRHIVSEVRRSAGTEGLAWLATNPTAPSSVGELTMGEAVEGLRELSELHLVSARFERAGQGWRISGIYPSVNGVLQVEKQEVLLAQAAPLLRALVGNPRDAVVINRNATTTIGDVALPSSELLFQLRLLRKLGFVSYEQGGRAEGILELRLTPTGREWLIAQYRDAQG